MYVFSRSPKYICPKCRTKISAEDMESIFQDQLKSFFLSEDEVRKHLQKADEALVEKQARLEMHRKELQKVKTEMQKTHRLYLDDALTVDGFAKIYKPLEEQERKLSDELPKLEAEIDLIQMSQLSADEVIAEALDLHRSWPKLSIPEKRKLIESITDKIVVTEDGVDITLSRMPTCEEIIKRQRDLGIHGRNQHELRGERHRPRRPRDGHPPFFQGLPQRLQHVAFKLRQLGRGTRRHGARRKSRPASGSCCLPKVRHRCPPRNTPGNSAGDRGRAAAKWREW
jgi:hypothetical protein